MARRQDGGGSRLIAGLHDALLMRALKTDETWHVDPPCVGCDQVALFASGEPVVVSAEELWLALFDEGRPRQERDFLTGRGEFVVTGDRVEGGRPGPNRLSGQREW